MSNDFDRMADQFTAGIEHCVRWKDNFYGAAYSTRIKAAITWLRQTIVEAERHPEIAPTPSPAGGSDEIAQTEAVAWAILRALHENVPEDKRPMSWSDMRDDQERRIRSAARAAVAEVRRVDAKLAELEHILNSEDGTPVQIMPDGSVRSPSPPLAAVELETTEEIAQQIAQAGTTGDWNYGQWRDAIATALRSEGGGKDAPIAASRLMIAPSETASATSDALRTKEASEVVERAGGWRDFEEAKARRARDDVIEECAKVADGFVADEEERAAKDEPGNITLHTLRMAVWSTARKAAESIRSLKSGASRG